MTKVLTKGLRTAPLRPLLRPIEGPVTPTAVWKVDERQTLDSVTPVSYTAPAGMGNGFSVVLAFVPTEFNDNALLYADGGSYYLRTYVNDFPNAMQVQVATVNGLEVNFSVLGVRLNELNIMTIRGFTDDVAASLNGGPITKDTSVAFPAAFSNLLFGSFGGLTPLNGDLVYAGISLDRWTDEQMRTLSSPNV